MLETFKDDIWVVFMLLQVIFRAIIQHPFLRPLFTLKQDVAVLTRRLQVVPLIKQYAQYAILYHLNIGETFYKPKMKCMSKARDRTLQEVFIAFSAN